MLFHIDHFSFWSDLVVSDAPPNFDTASIVDDEDGNNEDDDNNVNIDGHNDIHKSNATKNAKGINDDNSNN